MQNILGEDILHITSQIYLLQIVVRKKYLK